MVDVEQICLLPYWLHSKTLFCYLLASLSSDCLSDVSVRFLVFFASFSHFPPSENFINSDGALKCCYEKDSGCSDAQMTGYCHSYYLLTLLLKHSLCTSWILLMVVVAAVVHRFWLMCRVTAQQDFFRWETKTFYSKWFFSLIIYFITFS